MIKVNIYTPDKKTLKTTFNCYTATTDMARNRGLMYINSLEEDCGMLFLFSKTEPVTFWMKNTMLSLDILFINEMKQIVNIKEKAQPFSTEPIPSELPIKYVLEINSGLAEQFNIQIKDLITAR